MAANSPPDSVTSAQTAFADEIARVKASGVLGESGRLAELFNFLAERGDDAEAVSQAEIAETVFGQGASESDDATVRVYIHRLRKRLVPTGVKLVTLRGLGYLLKAEE